jgi:hypothetical protein
MGVLPPNLFVAEPVTTRSAGEPAAVSILSSIDAAAGPAVEECRFVLDEVRFMADIEVIPAFLAGPTLEFLDACKRDQPMIPAKKTRSKTSRTRPTNGATARKSTKIA